MLIIGVRKLLNKSSYIAFLMIIQIGQDCVGQCIPVKCDHANDEEVKQLFEKVSKEQNGRLDVLVNNAYAGVQVSQLHAIALYTDTGKLLTTSQFPRLVFLTGHYFTIDTESILFNIHKS